MLHELGPLLLALLLETIEPLGHLGSDLLRGFKGRHEFLLINLILGSEKSSELRFTLL